MLTIKHLRENIRKNLRLVTDHVADCVAQDMTDINRYAEDFYCGLLNKAFGYKLRNLNREMRNCPAIDLADDENGIGVQVTSTVTRAKVTGTLKKFFDGHLDDKYHRLILLVIGKEDDFRDPFRVERGFDFDPDRDIWDTPTLLGKLENIENIDTLKAVDEYLQKNMTISSQEDKPLLDLPLRTAMAEGSFMGRGAELARIAERFETERIVVLSGLGGMGKTELAVRFGKSYADSGAGRAWFAGFRRDFYRTVVDSIALGVAGLAEQKLDEPDKYRETMKVLNRCSREDLLIIDNADTEEGSFEQLRAALSALPMRILITTRCDAVGAIDVGALRREELHRIFRLYNESIPEADMDALIDAVDAHTLTVDLMARSMRRGRRAATAEKLLTALNSRDLNSPSFMQIATNYPGGLKQARINEHLRTVFRVAELSDAEQYLLRCATLLPAGGMSDELFMFPFGEKMQDVLDDLIQKGWLLWENDLLKIHPVICIVCREELEPSEENCGNFLDALWGQFDPMKHERVKFAQLAEVFANALEMVGAPQTKAEWLNCSGRLWNDLMESQRCAALYEAYIPVLELHIPDHPLLAIAYNNVGSTYSHLGDHAKALEYKLKDLEICEKVLPPEHPDLAGSYNNVGSTYGDLGDHQKALEYQMKALAILEKVLPPEHPDLAISYNNVGSTYSALGDHTRALEYQLKDLTICEKVLPPEHPDLATSYNNVGSTYGDLGDHQKALEYQLKDMAILEKVLPPEHPDLATSYNNVGGTYGALGDHQKALEYQLKALEILEKSLPENHPYNAMCCNNVAGIYYEMGEYETALSYIRRAADIAERSLPEGHPYRTQYRKFEMMLISAIRQRRDSE